MQPRTKEDNFHSNVINTMYWCVTHNKIITEQIFIISTCRVELSMTGNPLGEENVSVSIIYNVQCIVHFNFYYLFTSLLGAIKTFFQLNKVLRHRIWKQKSWGQLASKFSFLVARTSILVAKNYLQEKIAYNILKVFLTSTKLSISYLLQNRLHNPYNGTCYKIHFYVFMYSVTVKLTDS